jgi:hypothetical protein
MTRLFTYPLSVRGRFLATFLGEIEKLKNEINHYFILDELINNPEKQEEFFKVLGV